jgi:hypothetical protein
MCSRPLGSGGVPGRGRRAALASGRGRSSGRNESGAFRRISGTAVRLGALAIVCGVASLRAQQPQREDLEPLRKLSRRITADVSGNAAAVGTLAVCEDVRTVRLQFSAYDRRTTDPEVKDAAVRSRVVERDHAGSTWRRQDASGCGADGSGDPRGATGVFHDGA